MEHFVAEACFHGSETSSGFRKVTSIFQIRGNCCDLLEYLFCANLWKQDFCSLIVGIGLISRNSRKGGSLAPVKHTQRSHLSGRSSFCVILQNRVKT